MDFDALVDAVLDTRFGEARRTTAKRKVNASIGKYWTMQAWSFKRRIPLSITVPYDASRRAYLITASVQLEDILGCYNENGTPLESLPNDLFEERYEQLDSYGEPEAFTIYGSDANLKIRFGPSPSEAKTFYLPYNAGPPTLSADADNLATYGWPANHHELVVVDARISMLMDENDPTWRELEPDRRRLYEAMVDALAEDRGGTTGSFGADTLGYENFAWRL